MTREMFNKIAITGFDQGPQMLEANARSTVPQTSIIQISKVKKNCFQANSAISQNRADQCDQMAIVLFQYFAIESNEIFPKSMKYFQSRFTILPSTK